MYSLRLLLGFYSYNIFYISLSNRYKLKPERNKKEYLLPDIISNQERLNIKTVLTKRALKSKNTLKSKNHYFIIKIT